MIEDNPPNVPSNPVPDELTELSNRRTLPPVDAVDARMVALSLSSMATTLEQIQGAVAAIPELARAVQILERQHETTLQNIAEAKGAANLAGGIATRALEEAETIRGSCDRIERAIGQLALSVQGLDERSGSLYRTVFPERDSPSTPPDIELADVVPIHRRHVMTGE